MKSEPKRQPALICYLEIPAPNMDAAISFYRNVFGWTMTKSDLSPHPYWEFSTGAGQLSGGLDSQQPVNGGGVLLYLKVENISETLGLIKSLGGSTFRDKFDIGGGFGFSATFKDPNGNILGLFSKE